MHISYEWLLEYLPEPLPLDELSEILTNIGLEVEGIASHEAIKGSLEGVVVGEVVECAPHPAADRLKLTSVDVGRPELLQIVCGAPNVAQGQKVLVATVGTVLYPIAGGSFEIKPAKIRGEKSNGMICAEDELGLGSSHDGIMVLPADAQVGMPASEWLRLPKPQTVLEIGLTPNRSDAMSHLGVARDICAYLTHHGNKNYTPKYPLTKLPTTKTHLPIRVEVQDSIRCPRYSGLVIKDVHVAESPEWLKEKLQAIGQQPLNNVVDVTNFVLHEMGYPLHAFDYDTISGNVLNIKTLAADTPFTTLDGKVSKLSEEDLMICDDTEALCMAGVYGGAKSAVTNGTKNIFLEAAYFDPKTIRRSSMRHNLRTEAAIHFEKKVDIGQTIEVLKRAATLIIDLAGGQIASDIVDVYPEELKRQQVCFRYDYINLICGKNYQSERINALLQNLGFEIVEHNDKQCSVLVPHYKADVTQAADIAEEVLRIDGLNHIEIPEQITFSISKNKKNQHWELKEKICDWLSGQGLHEILTNSIVNSANYPEANQVKMMNSLSSELNAMRPQLLPSGLEVLEYNINRGEKNLALYEWGNVYHRFGPEKFQQEAKLAIWITGLREEQQWQQESIAYDIYFLKGLLQSLAVKLGIGGLVWRQEEQMITLVQGKKKLAEVYQPSKDLLKKYGIKQDVFYAELQIETWVEAALLAKTRYKEINKFPAVERDLSLVLDAGINFTQIEESTRQVKAAHLKSYKLFDIFEGDKLGEGKRAWALNYVFQANDKTLTDSEVDETMKKLIQAYEQDLGAVLRK